MINPAWLFVLATIIAVLGILAAFKNLMAYVQQKIEAKEEVNMLSLQKKQGQFFIKVALSESIPLILIVFGFMLMDSLENHNPFIPLVIIMAVLIFALFQVLTIRRNTLGYEEASTEIKTNVNTLCFLGGALISAIPIISIVAVLVM
jgi:F0F1-type ATP synthase membrane subunit c/vacuolar-type H+-ATPase subunit K